MRGDLKPGFSDMRVLMLGNGAAQALQFFAIFLLSRIYQPEDFGLLVLVQSVATLSVVVATLQLHLTIPLAKSATDAQFTASVVESICIGICVIMAPFAFLLGGPISFAVVVTLAVGLTNTYCSYLVFQGRFRGLAGFYIIRSILIISLQFGLAVLEIDGGLLWGAMIAEILAAVYLRFAILGRLPISRSIRAAFALAIRNRPFSVFGTLQELISVSAFYAPLILFTHYFGENVGGHYAMANRLVWAPVILVSSSVAQVLYHRFGKNTPRSLKDLWDFGQEKLLVAIVVIGCLASFKLESVYLWALGAEWVLASHLLPLQLTWGGIFLLSTPFRVACRVLRLQKYQLMIDLVMVAAICVTFRLVEIDPVSLTWCLVGLALLQHCAVAAVFFKFSRQHCARA